jgi:hypothetical protein
VLLRQNEDRASRDNAPGEVAVDLGLRSAAPR